MSEKFVLVLLAGFTSKGIQVTLLHKAGQYHVRLDALVGGGESTHKANTSVSHVWGVDMWQRRNFPGRDWKSLAAQFQVKRR